MTIDEIIEGMINGTFDTRKFSDAVLAMRAVLGECDDEILKAFDVGDSWLFGVGFIPQWDDKPVPGGSTYLLKKGDIVPVLADDSDEILTRAWPEVPIPDPA